jgi:hypothetical protein
MGWAAIREALGGIVGGRGGQAGGVTTEPGASVTMAVTDSVARELEAERSLTQALAVTDSVDREAEFSRLEDQIVIAGATVSTELDALRAVSDASAVSDSVATELVIGVALSSAAAVAEAIATEMQFERSPSDALVLAVTTAIEGEIESSASDAVAATEAVATELEAERSASDALVLAVTTAAEQTLEASASDAVAYSDTVTTALEYERALTQAVVYADTVATEMELERLSDQIVIAAETTTAALEFERSLTQAVAVSDSVATEVTAEKALTQAVAYSDTAATELEAERALTQAIVVPSPNVPSWAVPNAFGGIAALSDTLTVNATGVTPTWKYLGEDATTGGGGWPAHGGYGNTLAYVAGSGGITLQAGAPGLGADDDSVYANHTNSGAYWRDASAHPDIGTNDIAVEAVIRVENDTDPCWLFDTIDLGGDSRLTVYNWTALSLVIDDGGSSSGISWASTTYNAWVHALWLLDRNDVGRLFINGVQISSTDISNEATALTFDADNRLCLCGVSDAANRQWQGHIAMVALYDNASWFAAVDMQACATERYQRWAGLWPTAANGNDAATAATRAGAATLDQLEGSNRRLYVVGPNAIRCCNRDDSVSTNIDGVLIEPASTNNCLRSETFDNGTWTKTRSSIVANAATAPDNMTTADTLHEDGTAAQSHYIGQSISQVSGTRYAFSVFAANVNRSWLALWVNAGNDTCTFNVATGALGGSSGGNYVTHYTEGPFLGGFYRCVVIFDADSTQSRANYIAIAEGDQDWTFDGLDQDSLYIWGAQHEVAVDSRATSYIPTTSAGATRAKDELTYPGIDNWPTANQRRIALTYLGPNIDIGSERSIICVDDATDWTAQNVELTVGADDNSPGAATITDDIFDGVVKTLQIDLQTDNLKLTVDASTSTDSDVGIPTGIDEIRIGQDGAGGQQPGGLIGPITISEVNLDVTTELQFERSLTQTVAATDSVARELS